MNRLDNEEKKIIIKAFELFTGSILKVLSESLESESRQQLNMSVTSFDEIQEIESLKDDNAIYKMDYAVGVRQGEIVILMPEELISHITDTLMGGSGEGAYKGSLSELEANSITPILKKTLKNVEDSFKTNYSHDLAFSAQPLLLFKEMADYKIVSETSSFNFIITYNLTLNEGQNFPIRIIINSETIIGIMSDLGVKRVAKPEKKIDISSLDVSRLSDVKINITAELGRARVPIKYALELIKGSLIELDSLSGEDIKVFANDVEFAYAQVVAVEDNFGLKITRIITPEERLGSI